VLLRLSLPLPGRPGVRQAGSGGLPPRESSARA
jgi:hypothetical protein